MIEPMKRIALAAILSATLTTGAALAEPGRAHAMLTLPHQNGQLALPLREIDTVFYVAPAADRGATLRLTGRALTDGKMLSGTDADKAWQALSRPETSSHFVWVGHLTGTLGIPRHAIQSLFYTDTEGKQRLRIAYPGDPAGKVLDGAEAQRVWEQLTAAAN